MRCTKPAFLAANVWILSENFFGHLEDILDLFRRAFGLLRLLIVKACTMIPLIFTDLVRTFPQLGSSPSSRHGPDVILVEGYGQTIISQKQPWTLPLF